MKYSVVFFENGLYGVRRNHWFSAPDYMDFRTVGTNYFWWEQNHRCFKDCFTTKTEAFEIYKRLTMKVTEVKE